VFNTPPGILDECIGSVYDQTYPHWELILVDDASSDPDTAGMLNKWRARDGRISVIRNHENFGISRATNRGIAEASGEFVAFVDHDDVLTSTALEWVASCAKADLIYSDEDKIGAITEHREPFFKPAWSPRLLLGINYINHLLVVRTELLRKLGGLRTGYEGAQDHDLLLRLSELPLTVAHIPAVMYHWRSWEQSTAQSAGHFSEAEERGRQAIEDAVHRRGLNARVGLGAGAPFNHRVLWQPEPDPPLVKVVIPTRDHVKMLRRVVDGLLNRTDGVRIHLVIVDNGSAKQQTYDYLTELVARHRNVTIIRIDDAFNYSRLCNAGAAAGPDAPLLLLLNNDVQIRHRDWLLQLSGWLRDPVVKGVGPKMRFPDGTIQHSGVVVGLGGIGNHYAMHLPDQPRHGNLHDQAREVQCVTAACMLIRADDFAKVGGFDESLPVDFQDVDLCLRLRYDVGGILMYDPTYPLIHEQSASRGMEGAASGYTVARFNFRWEELVRSPDPYYNPHLVLHLKEGRHELDLAAIPDDRRVKGMRMTPRIVRQAATDGPLIIKR
jgi:GT2 family glycosyltransferase